MNVFARALNHAVDERFRREPRLLQDIWELCCALNSGHFDQGWVDVMMQTHRPRFDLYDAYGFSMLWSSILGGRLLYAICNIGVEPHRNADRNFNADVLSRLKRISNGNGEFIRCSSEFWGGLEDSDGYFEWFDNLVFTCHADRPCVGGVCDLSERTARPRRLPLEVGVTEVGTTLGHVLSESGVVRWPYGSRSLYMLLKAEALADRLPDT